MRHLIETTIQKRQALWLKLFGLETLPVLSSCPRWQVIDGRETLAYDLDLSALGRNQRNRLSAHVAWSTGRPYSLVKLEVDNRFAWPIDATGCHVVNEQETAIRPSLFMPVARRMLVRLAWAG